MRLELTLEEFKHLFKMSEDDPVLKKYLLDESIVSVPDAKPEDLVKAVSPLDEITAEEMLYFATPYYDELQAKKEAHLKKLKEEG